MNCQFLPGMISLPGSWSWHDSMHPSPCRPPDGEYSTSKQDKLSKGVALLLTLNADSEPRLVERVRKKRKLDATRLAKEENEYIYNKFLLLRWKIMVSKLKYIDIYFDCKVVYVWGGLDLTQINKRRNNTAAGMK